MIYSGYKVYGPYLAKDGRLRVVLCHPSGQMKTVSYPKYLLENSLDRLLSRDETVHHLDGNPRNNELPNLCVIPKRVHSRQDVKRHRAQSFVCPMCGKPFVLKDRSIRSAVANRKRGQAGPFCCRKCTGLYGTLVRHGKLQRLEVKLIKPDYYKISELSPSGGTGIPRGLKIL